MSIASELNKLVQIFKNWTHTVSIPPATAETLGGVKVGDGLEVTEDGTLSATGGGFEQVQADWNEERSMTPAYIKNKPVVPNVEYFEVRERDNGDLYFTELPAKSKFLQWISADHVSDTPTIYMCAYYGRHENEQTQTSYTRLDKVVPLAFRYEEGNDRPFVLAAVDFNLPFSISCGTSTGAGFTILVLSDS